MAIFNSYVSLSEGKYNICPLKFQKVLTGVPNLWEHSDLSNAAFGHKNSKQFCLAKLATHVDLG
jgi:hypothetical protein